MTKLFLSISLGIMVAVVLSTVASVAFTRAFFEPPNHGFPPEWQRNFINELQTRLGPLPPAQWLGELERLRREVPAPLKLTDIHRPMPRETRERLAAGRPSEVMTDHGPTTLVPLRDGVTLVELGPMGPPGRPPGLSHFLVSIAITIPIVGIIGFLLAYPVVRRLRVLENAAGRIAEGDLHARADLKSNDAVGSLALRFNTMADKIQTLLESQHHLLQAVSHELRTPISRIGFTLALLADDEQPASRARRITAIEHELAELEHLIGELLLYCRFDVEDPYQHLEKFAVHPAIERVVRPFGASNPNIAIRLSPPGASPCEIKANRRYFERALHNLLSNAQRYAQTRIDVQVECLPGEVQIAVGDDGPGVPPEKRNLVFEPFARVDDSRSRESGGVGLGLAIVRRILEAHGGSIELTANDSGGAIFVMHWPVA